MNKYYQKLMNQFLATVGFEKEINLELMENAIDWLKEYKNKLNIYRDFLKSNGITFDGRVIELNKGLMDTVIEEKSSSYLLTEETLNRNYNVLNGELFTFEDQRFCMYKKNLLSIENFETFITHNPYNYSSLNNIIKCQNEVDICVGIIGNIHDKDYNLKIDKLKKFQSKLLKSTEIYETNNDEYFYLVKSISKN